MCDCCVCGWLQFYGYTRTLDCFKAEIRSHALTAAGKDDDRRRASVVGPPPPDEPVLTRDNVSMTQVRCFGQPLC